MSPGRSNWSSKSCQQVYMGYLRLEEAWQMVRHYFPGVSVTGEQVSNLAYRLTICRELAAQPAFIGIQAGTSAECGAAFGTRWDQPDLDAAHCVLL